jgi:PAS domain S-box-containing protein
LAETLRRQRLFDVVMATTSDCHCVVDGDCRITYANPAFLDLWRVTLAEALGKSFGDLGYEPWHAAMHGCEVAQVIRTREPVSGEVAINSFGIRVIHEYQLVPVLGVDGGVEEVCMTMRNISERRAAAEKAQFISNLAGQLEPLATEEEIIRHAVEALGRLLDVHRCYFVECVAGGTKIIVGENWVRDRAPTLAGTLSLFDAGGQEWCSWYFAGRGAFADVRCDPLTSHRASYYEAIQVSAYVVQPVKRDGHHTVVLAVTENRPRVWTADELGLLERVAGVVWPLVERARAVRQVAEAEQRMRLVSDHIPGVVNYIGRDLCVQFNNRACAAGFGFQAAGLEGVHMRTLLGEEIFQQRLPFLERVLAGEIVRFQGPVNHHVEGPQLLDLTYIPDFDPNGQVRGFYVLGFDVTEHKRTREALASRSDRQRLLWACARVLLTTEDPDTMLHRLFSEIGGNLGADAFFNFVVENPGKTLRLRSWRGISDAEAQMLSQIGFNGGACGEVARTCRPVVRSVATEGLGLCAYAGYPLISDGQLLGTLGFASRTKQAFSSDELEFIEILSHYVTAAYVRLELMANLRETDRRKDEFLATLAHELRNPLAPICTGVEVLRKVQDNPQQAREIIGVIERQAVLMVRLIDDLVDVSRITRGNLQLETAVVDLGGILASALETARPLIDSGGHQVVAPENLGEILLNADAGRLSQVFSNLLNNAARYTPDGGRIELLVDACAESVSVTVRDNGEGIAPEMQERIFEMFTQVSRSGKSATEGLGIGLGLVRLLVQMHGGSIQVHSDGLGEGSEFRVTLPRVMQECVPATAQSVAVVPRSLRVMVVDDGVSAADMLAMFLELEGFEVRTAYDGLQALEVAAQLQPQVVFLDLGMPRLDGFQTARRIRQLPGCAKVTLIALTGWGQDSDRRRTKEAGFDYHLVKPIEPRMLREMLANLPLEQKGMVIPASEADG